MFPQDDFDKIINELNDLNNFVKIFKTQYGREPLDFDELKEFIKQQHESKLGLLEDMNA